MWASLPELLGRGELYATEGLVPFLWNPLAGYLMAGVSFLGYWSWVALHVAAVLLLRDWRPIGLVLVAYPFWVDTALGNTFTFQVIAGMLAIGGSRRWALGYLALAVLIPRPVVAPLAVWLLWKQPTIRAPFAVTALGAAAFALASGYAGDWATTVIGYGHSEIVGRFTLGPSALMGPAWLAIGIPLGVWLTWRGWPGLAGLAVSPYVFAYYLLIPPMDLARRTIPAPVRLTG